MNTIRNLAILLLSTSALLSPSIQAQPTAFTLGVRLSAAEVQALGPLKPITIDSKNYQILQRTNTANGLVQTLVLDPNRRIGSTLNEIVIANHPTDTLIDKVPAILAKASSITKNDNAQLSVLRFATLEEAVASLPTLRSALPSAAISLPVSTATPKVR